MMKLNKEYCTWKDIVSRFPHKWVIVEDPELDEFGDFESGNIVFICDDEEVDDLLIDCYKKGMNISHIRTTEESGVGIINVENYKYVAV